VICDFGVLLFIKLSAVSRQQLLAADGSQIANHKSPFTNDICLFLRIKRKGKTKNLLLAIGDFLFWGSAVY
jgi:hypothetical protein